MVVNSVVSRAKRILYPLVRASLERGLPPAWLRYESVLKETVPEYFARNGENGGRAGACETVHPRTRVSNPLPRNIERREDLPKDRGWWGYSFWDVPSRISTETRINTLPDCCIVPQVDPESNEFWVAILNKDRRALNIREMIFSDRHADVLRSSRSPKRVKRVTWILERVYHNHSHWLTAHLPKLLLLKQRDGGLDDVYLPRRRSSVLDASLRMIGLDPDAFPTFDPDRPIIADELTLIETDRFRPELLRSVRIAVGNAGSTLPRRRLFVSRANATRRRLVNEEVIWPLLQEAGFERVYMEELSFERQVALMQEAAVVAAPHGAGLTNVLFCGPGTHVVEIADLSFPNPNFYALASALGHHYWIISAEGIGDAHPLDRDMHVEPSAVAEVLARLRDRSVNKEIEA